MFLIVSEKTFSKNVGGTVSRFILLSSYKNLAYLILVANAVPLHETNNLCYAPLHEKFLCTEIFLVFIFPYLDKKKLLEKRSAFCLW